MMQRFRGSGFRPGFEMAASSLLEGSGFIAYCFRVYGLRFALNPKP